MVDFKIPAEVKTQIDEALTAGISAANGFPVIEEAIIASIAARYAYHTMVQPRANFTQVPPELAAAIAGNIASHYAQISAMAMSAKRHDFKFSIHS